MLRLELDNATATLEAVNLRTEKFGPDKVPAAELKVSVAQDADVLANFSPTLKEFLFHTEGTLDLAGGFALRDPHLGYPLSRDEEMANATVRIGYGPGTPMEFTDCRVNSFKLTPLDGGSVIISARVQCKPSPEQVAKLYTLQETGIELSVIPAELPTMGEKE
jgi:hypothetical protein